MARIKISQAAKEFNVSIPTVIEQLQKTGITIDGSNPNTRLDENAYRALVDAFQPRKSSQTRFRAVPNKGSSALRPPRRRNLKKHR